MHVSRRGLVFGAAPAGLASAQQKRGLLTAGDVIERIKKNVGVRGGATVDTIKSGTPDTPVRGIATTMMATLDVVQRAAAAGRTW